MKIDGRWIHDVPLAELRASLGVIPQDPTLFRCVYLCVFVCVCLCVYLACTVSEAQVLVFLPLLRPLPCMTLLALGCLNTLSFPFDTPRDRRCCAAHALPHVCRT